MKRVLSLLAVSLLACVAPRIQSATPAPLRPLDPINVGVLHSLTGTVAPSERRLKDTVLMEGVLKDVVRIRVPG